MNVSSSSITEMIRIWMSFIGQVCLRGICYSDRSSTVQQNNSNRTGHRQQKNNIQIYKCNYGSFPALELVNNLPCGCNPFFFYQSSITGQKTFILLSSSPFIHLLSTHSSNYPLHHMIFFLFHCGIGIFTQVYILFSSYGLMRNLSFLSLSRVRGLFT